MPPILSLNSSFRPSAPAVSGIARNLTTNSVMPGLRVEIYHPSRPGQMLATTTTDADGHFTIDYPAQVFSRTFGASTVAVFDVVFRDAEGQQELNRISNVSGYGGGIASKKDASIGGLNAGSSITHFGVVAGKAPCERETSPRCGVIAGTLTSFDGRAIPGSTVLAFQVRLQAGDDTPGVYTNVPVGRTVTSLDGSFELPVTLPALPGGLASVFRLSAYAWNPDSGVSVDELEAIPGAYAESLVVTGDRVDVQLRSSQNRAQVGWSEFDVVRHAALRVTADVFGREPHWQDDPVVIAAAARLDLDRVRDLLQASYSVSVLHVEHVLLAGVSSLDVWYEANYALARAGIDLRAGRNLRLSFAMLHAATAAAIEQGIASADLATHFPDAWEAYSAGYFRGLARWIFKEGPYPGGSTAYSAHAIRAALLHVVDTVLGVDAAETASVELLARWLAFRADSTEASFWTDSALQIDWVAALDVETEFSILRYAIETLRCVRWDVATLDAIVAEAGGAYPSLGELSAWPRERWHDVAVILSPSATEEQIDERAGLLFACFSAFSIGTSFLASAQPALPVELLEYLQSEGLRIADAPLHLLDDAVDAVVAELDRPAAREALRAASRVRRLVADPGLAAQVLAAGYGSAHAIARAGRERFVADLPGVSASRARKVFARAEGVVRRAAALRVAAIESSQYASVQFLAPPPDALSVGGLSGGLGTANSYCATDACESVLSPAAYLVDLLAWLGRTQSAAGATFVEDTVERPETLLDVFAARRPDIVGVAPEDNLLLDCASTHDEVPYIELAMRQLAVDSNVQDRVYAIPLRGMEVEHFHLRREALARLGHDPAWLAVERLRSRQRSGTSDDERLNVAALAVGLGPHHISMFRSMMMGGASGFGLMSASDMQALPEFLRRTGLTLDGLESLTALPLFRGYLRIYRPSTYAGACDVDQFEVYSSLEGDTRSLDSSALSAIRKFLLLRGGILSPALLSDLIAAQFMVEDPEATVDATTALALTSRTATDDTLRACGVISVVAKALGVGIEEAFRMCVPAHRRADSSGQPVITAHRDALFGADWPEVSVFWGDPDPEDADQVAAAAHLDAIAGRVGCRPNDVRAVGRYFDGRHGAWTGSPWSRVLSDVVDFAYIATRLQTSVPNVAYAHDAFSSEMGGRRARMGTDFDSMTDSDYHVASAAEFAAFVGHCAQHGDALRAVLEGAVEPVMTARIAALRETVSADIVRQLQAARVAAGATTTDVPGLARAAIAAAVAPALDLPVAEIRRLLDLDTSHPVSSQLRIADLLDQLGDDFGDALSSVQFVGDRLANIETFEPLDASAPHAEHRTRYNVATFLARLDTAVRAAATLSLQVSELVDWAVLHDSLGDEVLPLYVWDHEAFTPEILLVGGVAEDAASQGSRCAKRGRAWRRTRALIEFARTLPSTWGSAPTIGLDVSTAPDPSSLQAVQWILGADQVARLAFAVGTTMSDLYSVISSSEFGGYGLGSLASEDADRVDNLIAIARGVSLLRGLGAHAPYAAHVLAVGETPPYSSMGPFSGTEQSAALRSLLEHARSTSVAAEASRAGRIAYLENRRDVSLAYDRVFHPDVDRYANHLVDVEMGGCRVATRMQEAMLAAQLFVHRCLMGLEVCLDTSVSAPMSTIRPSAEFAKQWEWMKQYRVWEANRRVFLYPENWIVPELRDTRTEPFRQLEATLAQAGGEERPLQDAFASYLSDVRAVARLQIVALYDDGERVEATANGFSVPRYISIPPASGIGSAGAEGKSWRFVTLSPPQPAPNSISQLTWTPPRSPEQRIEGALHLIGRTMSEPREYYHRVRENGLWSGWVRIQLDVAGEHVVPVVHNGRLHLFWGVIEPAKAASDVGATATPPTRVLGVRWSRREPAGQWTAPRSVASKTLPASVAPHAISFFTGKVDGRLYVSYVSARTETSTPESLIDDRTALGALWRWSDVTSRLESDFSLVESVHIARQLGHSRVHPPSMYRSGNSLGVFIGP